MTKKIDFEKLAKVIKKSCSTDPGQETPKKFINNLFDNETIAKNVNGICQKVAPIFGMEVAMTFLFLFAFEMGLSAASEDIYEEKKEMVH